ncbi:GNAT family N-acetyltransferase [Alteromonas sp. AMM-1]|uniref:GNAT family N-acetyltransferase n=1 Tax=Alteromonas sp. AMM-1 TaxID=3394233 RepID=UPI0039A5513B
MITLRDFELSDVQRLVEILNDRAVTAFLSTKIPTPYTREDALWWIEEGSKEELIKAITVNDRLVGCVGVHQGSFEYSRSGEIGYWLASDYWRQGISLAAILQLTEQVFANTEIVRIFGCVFSANEASKRLMLKAGFQLEAVLKNAICKQEQFYDSYVFAKLKPA